MSKKKPRAKLPRGLWVGQLRKPSRYWADPATPEYFDKWYYRIRKSGLPQQLRAMPDVIQTKTQAEEHGRLEFQAAELRAINELRESVAAAKARRGRVVTIGEYLDAFEKVAIQRGLKQHKRSASALRLVMAVAKGWMPPMSDKRMDGDGGKLVDQVRALPLSEVNETTKLEYMRRMQGEPHRVNLDRNNPPEVNATINSTLMNARVPFSAANRIHEVRELNVPWTTIEGFCTLLLPEARHDVGADIPTADAFGKMMTAWRADASSNDPAREERALVNELFRLLGLRSGELVMARESWLHTGADKRSYLWVRNYPAEGWSCKTTNQAKLPLTDTLALHLRARCLNARAAGIDNPHLILPHIPGLPVDPITRSAPETPARYDLIRTQHNAWLKTFIGEVKSGQGNHRLRKYCATRIYAEELASHHNEAKAATRVKEYLRHSKEATALLHYIAKNDERLATVTDATLMPAVAA